MKNEKGLTVPALMAASCVVITSALAAFGGFLLLIPYSNMGAAVIAAPLASLGICLLYGRGLTPVKRRVLAGIASVFGAYAYTLVTMGVVSAMFGAQPLAIDEMRYVEFGDYIDDIGPILRNTANYLFLPKLLFSELIGRGEGIWATQCTAAFFVMAGLPQALTYKIRAPKPKKEKQSVDNEPEEQQKQHKEGKNSGTKR